MPMEHRIKLAGCTGAPEVACNASQTTPALQTTTAELQSGQVQQAKPQDERQEHETKNKLTEALRSIAEKQQAINFDVNLVKPITALAQVLQARSRCLSHTVNGLGPSEVSRKLLGT